MCVCAREREVESVIQDRAEEEDGTGKRRGEGGEERGGQGPTSEAVLALGSQDFRDEALRAYGEPVVVRLCAIRHGGKHEKLALLVGKDWIALSDGLGGVMLTPPVVTWGGGVCHDAYGLQDGVLPISCAVISRPCPCKRGRLSLPRYEDSPTLAVAIAPPLKFESTRGRKKNIVPAFILSSSTLLSGQPSSNHDSLLLIRTPLTRSEEAQCYITWTANSSRELFYRRRWVSHAHQFVCEVLESKEVGEAELTPVGMRKQCEHLARHPGIASSTLVVGWTHVRDFIHCDLDR